jgi:hypothetical protein
MPKILKAPFALPLALIALSLTACASVDPLTPDAARFTPVALPVAPAGEADCDGEPCLSERESAALFNSTIDALCAANNRLAWLSDYYLGTSLPPSCGD